MKGRSSGSADDGAESSLESDNDPAGRPSLSVSRSEASSQTRSRISTSTNPGSRQGTTLAGNGFVLRTGPPVTKGVSLPSRASMAVSTPPSAGIGMPKISDSTDPPRSRRSFYSISFLSLFISFLGICLLLAILNSLVTRHIDPKGCRMSYMRPSYVPLTDFDTEHTRFATKYSLYLYREQGVDDESRLHGIPVLFIPGNAGSYKQVRPIAAEAASYFYNHLQYDGSKLASGTRNLDFFTVDFNEDITAFHGQTLLDQAEYLNEAVRFILSLYSDPQRTSRDSALPDPTSVIILGHSMGGVVARAMLVQPNYQSNSINTIITMSAPHARPPVTFDGQIVQIYDEINAYWRHAYTQKWANNNPLWHVTLVSIAGGNLDTIVPSDYASLESLVPETHGFTVFTTGIPTVWTSMDHQAILWCDQFRKVVARALFDVVDVHRASQTKPRADRMRAFKKRFLTGLEATSEKPALMQEATTLLTIDDASTGVVHAGERLVLPLGGSASKPKAYLLAIPPRGTPKSKRFSFLTDARLSETSDNSQVEVLLCNIFPLQSNQPGPPSSAAIDLSEGKTQVTRLACKNAGHDATLLPASTLSSALPFPTGQESDIQSFSYLQYDLEHLSEHEFVAVVDKSPSKKSSFIIAEFSDVIDYHQNRDISLARLLMFGLSTTLPAERPMVSEIKIPSIASSLLVYDLTVSGGRCGDGNSRQALFAPMMRQYLNRPFESRFFVNVQNASVSLHGVAPYLPPSLDSKSADGVGFQFWTDPTCDSPLNISIQVDVLTSLGKLYMRYRTVFAAFPLLIVTLVLRKQFHVYDRTGVFVSFIEALELSLRRSIPLMLLSLTLLSMAIGGAATTDDSLLGNRKATFKFPGLDFHRNDLLIGTDDPFFWYLTPLIGIICTGVCVGVHYSALLLTSFLSLLYGLVRCSSMSSNVGSEHRRAHSPAFPPSTPRRRMITTAALLFLVSIFIPYQFAYLVSCLVQLFTVVRALRTTGIDSLGASENAYNYAHSIFLLMLWVLPINIPILAVWIRNLAVHWLTPFSSHHNVLSIMPFILLVENLTTGRMVPQLRSGLRHVTSVLLFGTALCAAIYGVSHAYMLHYLVNIIAAWLAIVHSTADSWSLTFLGSMFNANGPEVRKGRKSP